MTFASTFFNAFIVSSAFLATVTAETSDTVHFAPGVAATAGPGFSAVELFGVVAAVVPLFVDGAVGVSPALFGLITTGGKEFEEDPGTTLFADAFPDDDAGFDVDGLVVSVL